MEVGNISESILKRAVLSQISHKRDEVIVWQDIGEECSIIDLDPNEWVILTTKSVSGTYKNRERIALHSVANKILAKGGQIFACLITILLPDNTYESALEKIIKEFETNCSEINIDILEVRTEVSMAVTSPVITVTGIGKCEKGKGSDKDLVKPGLEIVMTGWAGLEGTSVIANKTEEHLLSRFTGDFVGSAKDLINNISIMEEAKLAIKTNPALMYAIGEGGIFAALWKMAEASAVGLEINLAKIPLKQETIEICELYDLNPYELASNGSMLVVTDQANSLVAKLHENKINAAVIGRITSGNEKAVINGDYKRFLTPPKRDELYKI